MSFALQSQGLVQHQAYRSYQENIYEMSISVCVFIWAKERNTKGIKERKELNIQSGNSIDDGREVLDGCTRRSGETATHDFCQEHCSRRRCQSSHKEFQKLQLWEKQELARDLPSWLGRQWLHCDRFRTIPRGPSSYHFIYIQSIFKQWKTLIIVQKQTVLDCYE